MHGLFSPAAARGILGVALLVSAGCLQPVDTAVDAGASPGPDAGAAACQTGYAGANCKSCADGYQDDDSNGTCTPTCGQAALVCGEHGACSDESGKAVCACADGYTGADCSVAPAACTPGVKVQYTGAVLPAGIAGQYTEAFDCVRSEGGAWFGGVDYAHCFRMNDGSAWRIWNTGCGWEYGRQERSTYDPTQTEWARYVRTYSGQCSAIPAEQLDTRALTTTVFYDGFGGAISGLDSKYCSP